MDVACAGSYSPSVREISSRLWTDHIFTAIQTRVEGENGMYTFFFAFDQNFDLCCYVKDITRPSDSYLSAKLGVSFYDIRAWQHMDSQMVKIETAGHAVYFDFIGVALRLTTVSTDDAYFKKLEFMSPY